ncbi:hypothetical protein HG15A2_29210 [Adhaeretor mobilis]|uniref:Uncharacterized protein n=1 Tax=Adhaeretor mobilis TaxID=1930276 RepID=A0A517MXI3_9BACT|nr:hypothetical protein HG15A2_29210 [Adhaeretor mobilis]
MRCKIVKRYLKNPIRTKSAIPKPSENSSLHGKTFSIAL